MSLGDFTNPSTLLAGLGFLIISILSIKKIPGAIIIGILTVTLMSFFLNLIEFNGIFALPPDVTPVLMELDILGALDVAMISVIVSFLFVNLFDTAGTLFGVATRANLIKESGDIKDLDKALKVDSSSSVFGSFLGCAPVTSYVESSAGIEAGGTLHRVSETVVSKLAQEAGLSVLRTSDLLKNPDDPLDVGVFSPTIRGKTSQFVVLFQK